MEGEGESIEVLINPDGTLKVKVMGFAERDSQPELTKLLESLNKQGIETSVSNNLVEYTGEYHKHTHTHEITDHMH